LNEEIQKPQLVREEDQNAIAGEETIVEAGWRPTKGSRLRSKIDHRDLQ
jgi:hypothetical protein